MKNNNTLDPEVEKLIKEKYVVYNLGNGSKALLIKKEVNKEICKQLLTKTAKGVAVVGGIGAACYAAYSYFAN